MIPLLLALACVPVDGPKLLARHLAVALPEFAQVTPEKEIGYAPAPGAVRIIRFDEAQRIGMKFGVAVNPPQDGVCFDWPMKPFDAALAEESMRRSLPTDAQLSILELSKTPVPHGTIEFPLSSLQGSVWRGFVRLSDSGRFDVWARVRVHTKQMRVVAASALRPGETIRPDQLRIEEFDGVPAAGFVPALEDAVGMAPRRAYAAGSALLSGTLERPALVLKGATVRLHASIGVARVSTDATAQARGNLGDTIAVKNVVSGRVVRARVDGPGEVSLLP